MANNLKKFHDAVIGVIGDGNTELYVPRAVSTPFTIAKSAWTKSNSETSEFVYYADIAVSGLTVYDYAEVNFTRASQSVISEANICPSGDTMAGKIRLFAEEIPTEAISGEYLVTKGAVPEGGDLPPDGDPAEGGE